jgi:hypothetical protein
VTHRIWSRSDDPVFRIAIALVAVVALVGVRATLPGPQPRTTFAAEIASLSEPGGYFDTDNLISNERSYLEVLSDLDERNVRGGVYIGVGPDQNFSYIAHVKPSIAFILDIRRDNLLLHLLFKALFEQSHTRIEYLALLFGRAVPADANSWRGAPIARLVEHIDKSAAEPKYVDELRARVDRVVKGFGVPLTSDDLATMARFHRRFIDSGLDLQFQSLGRPAQSHYPTYRDLLLATDRTGRQGNYLVSEDAFQFVKSLQDRDRIIPVTGDLSGPSALVAIGRRMSEKGETLSAFYASNVEFYLKGQGVYLRFVNNLGRVPHTNRSVIIRSIFNRGMGIGSASEIQAVEEVLSQSLRR